MAYQEQTRRGEFEAARKAAVTEHLENLAEHAPQSPAYREDVHYKHFVDSITRAARDHAIKEQLSAEDFDDLLHISLNIPSQIASALQPNDPTDKQKPKYFWSHDRFFMDHLRQNLAPYMSREDICYVVGEYLELSFRSTEVDNLFVDMLIALELYAFGDEMLNEKPNPYGSPRSPFKRRHPLLNWLIGQFWMLLLLIGPVILISQAAYTIPGSGWSWAMVGLIILYLLGTLLSLIALPFAWARHRRSVLTTKDLLVTMGRVYGDLDGTGPISARYIRDRALNAAEKGVAWPPPLFALLDDIIARDGRF